MPPAACPALPHACPSWRPRPPGPAESGRVAVPSFRAAPSASPVPAERQCKAAASVHSPTQASNPSSDALLKRQPCAAHGRRRGGAAHERGYSAQPRAARGPPQRDHVISSRVGVVMPCRVRPLSSLNSSLAQRPTPVARCSPACVAQMRPQRVIITARLHFFKNGGSRRLQVSA